MTKEQWDALSPKGRWDIIVAQRGPDLSNSETLKWFTTAVIRAEMGQILRAWGGSATINGDLKSVLLPNGRIPGASGSFDYGHFLEHIHSACSYMDIGVAHVRADLWKAAMDLGARTGNLWMTADKIISGIPEGYREHPPYAEFIRHANEYLKPKYRGWESIRPEMPVEAALGTPKSQVLKQGRKYNYILETDELGKHSLKKIPIDQAVKNENL